MKRREEMLQVQDSLPPTIFLYVLYTLIIKCRIHLNSKSLFWTFPYILCTKLLLRWNFLFYKIRQNLRLTNVFQKIVLGKTYFSCWPSIKRPQFLEFGISIIQNFFQISIFLILEWGGLSKHPIVHFNNIWILD